MRLSARHWALSALLCLNSSMLWADEINSPAYTFSFDSLGFKHSTYASDVSFSPNGYLVASSGYDFSVRIWNVATQEGVSIFKPNAGKVYATVFSPDGNSLVAANEDGSLVLWNAETQTVIQRFTGHTAAATTVAFSPDGQFLISGSADNSLKLWNVSTGEEIRSFTGHIAQVNEVAFSPDGQTVISGSEDTSIRIWSVADGSQLFDLGAHSDAVNSVVYSPDGQYFAAASNDGSVSVWNSATGVFLRMLSTASSSSTTSVSFSDDSQTVYVARGNMLEHWDINTGSLIYANEPDNSSNYSSITSLEPSSTNSNLLATAHSDGGITLRNATTGVASHVLGQDFYMPTQFKLSPDGQYLATADTEEVSLWNVNSGQKIRTLGEDARGNPLIFSPDGRSLFTSSYSSSFAQWDIDNAQLLRVFDESTIGVSALAMSSDGSLIATGAGSNPISIVDATTGTLMQSFGYFGSRSMTSSVIELFFPPEENEYLFATVKGSMSSTLSLSRWDIQTGDSVYYTFTDTVQGQDIELEFNALSPDTHIAAAVGGVSPEENTILIYDVDNSVPLLKFATHNHTDGFANYGSVDVAFAPNNSAVVSVDTSRFQVIEEVVGKEKYKYEDKSSIYLWDANTGEILRTFNTPHGTVSKVFFSPSGRYIYTVNDIDRSISRWPSGLDIETTDCPNHTCPYRIARFDEYGFYVIRTSLPTGQAEGQWGLSIARNQAYNRSGFSAGSVLRENGTAPGFISFYQTEAAHQVELEVQEYTGQMQQVLVEVKLNNQTTVFGPVLVETGSTVKTGLLDPGYYVATVTSPSDAPRGYFGLGITGHQIGSNIDLGGMLDDHSGLGFIGLPLGNTDVLEMNLLYGENYGSVGAGKPELEILRTIDNGELVPVWSTYVR